MNKKIVLTCIIFLMSFVFTSEVFAVDVPDPEEPQPQWKGEVELGYVETGGNTDTSTATLKSGVLRETGKWRHGLKLEALHSSDEGATTAERFVLSEKTDYKLSLRDYVFLTLRYEDDRFSGYDYRVIVTSGYGRSFVPTENTKLNLELGPGYRQSKVHKSETEKEVIARAALAFKWSISKSATFTQDASVEAGELGAFIKSVTALKTKINKTLALKASYTVRHNTEVPSETKNTDTVTALTLVYGF